jgi:hypothetical protein
MDSSYFAVGSPSNATVTAIWEWTSEPSIKPDGLKHYSRARKTAVDGSQASLTVTVGDGMLLLRFFAPTRCVSLHGAVVSTDLHIRDETNTMCWNSLLLDASAKSFSWRHKRTSRGWRS